MRSHRSGLRVAGAGHSQVELQHELAVGDEGLPFRDDVLLKRNAA
jgi:hypothetical protein